MSLIPTGSTLEGWSGHGLAVTSVYPYFAISAGLLLMAHVIGRRSSFYRGLVTRESRASRFHSIDGLRGFLALAVYFHHAVIAYHFHQHGRWEVPTSNFYTLCGQLGVVFFFMITAFLFWTKGLAAPAEFRAQSFFWSRITRIVPMYAVSVVCVFAVALIATGLRLQEPVRALLQEFLVWSSFGFADPPSINGLPNSHVINSVYWTLRLEWLFYLFLPLGLVFADGWGFLLLLAVVLTIRATGYTGIPAAFIFGALAAVITARFRDAAALRWIRWNSWPVSAVLLLLLVTLFNGFGSGYGPVQALLMFIMFLMIANGNTLFGLFTSAAARVLGTISYSVYLMHSVLLYLCLLLVDAAMPIKGMPAAVYWCVVAAIGVLLVAVSCLTYRTIEHPLLKAKMPMWLRGGSAPVAAPTVADISRAGSR